MFGTTGRKRKLRLSTATNTNQEPERARRSKSKNITMDNTASEKAQDCSIVRFLPQASRIETWPKTIIKVDFAAWCTAPLLGVQRGLDNSSLIIVGEQRTKFLSPAPSPLPLCYLSAKRLPFISGSIYVKQWNVRWSPVCSRGVVVRRKYCTTFSATLNLLLYHLIFSNHLGSSGPSFLVASYLGVEVTPTQ